MAAADAAAGDGGEPPVCESWIPLGDALNVRCSQPSLSAELGWNCRGPQGLLPLRDPSHPAASPET